MIFFETIKCEDKEIFNLDYHQRRIAKTVGLNINLSDYIYSPSNKLLKCKITYDTNGILDIIYNDYIPKDIKTFKLIYNNDIAYKYKMLDRNKLDILYSQKQNADEIIIIKDGYITDTSIANIAIYDGNHWLTPRVPLLEGTVKNRLVDEGKLILKDITVTQLKNAKKLALLNAMIGFKIINNFDIIL